MKNWFLLALICLMFVIIVLTFVSIYIYMRNRKLLKEGGVANGYIADIKLSSEWGYNAAIIDAVNKDRISRNSFLHFIDKFAIFILINCFILLIYPCFWLNNLFDLWHFS